MLEAALRSLAVGDLDAVARIHIRVFPHDGRSQLGPAVVQRSFAWQMRRRNPVFASGAFHPDTDELLGFCFGGSYGDHARGFLRNHLLFVALQVARRPQVLSQVKPLEQLSKRIAARRLVRRGQVPDATGSPPHSDYEVFSLAVEPEFQGVGLGRRLMLQHEAKALEWGCAAIRLEAPADTLATIAFYERIGFAKMPGEPLWRGTMIKPLRG